jgi:GNAT superfamily N-acetyltransferase
MDGVELRLLGAGDDLDELTALLHRAYAELGRAGLNFTAVDQDASVTARRVRGKECWLALVDGRLAGTVTLADGRPADVPDFGNGRPVGFVEQLGVDPAFRGRGLGRRLLDRVEERARERGLGVIALDTAAPAARLLRLYAARGYREVDRVRFPGKTYESVVLAKPL